MILTQGKIDKIPTDSLLNNRKVAIPAHAHELPFHVVHIILSLSVFSASFGTLPCDWEGADHSRTLKVKPDHLSDASMKVGFVKFGFLNAGPDDAHGRCERSGQLFENLVEIKQQVQRFWPAARERKLGFVVALHNKVATRG